MNKSQMWAAVWGALATVTLWAAFDGWVELALGLWFVSNAPLIWSEQAKR